MIADGDCSMAYTTTDQSESILPSESKLLSEPQPDLAAHLVDIQNDAADVVNSVISTVTADDGNICTTVTLEAQNILSNCQSMPVCSTDVFAASDAVDDVEIVEILNGNNHIICACERIL